MRSCSSYPVMVVCDGITAIRDMATALESGDQIALVTLSSAGIVARSVHRSMSTGAVGRSGRSSGRKMFAPPSLARGARAQPESATASMKRHARPFPLLTPAIKDADRRMRNGLGVSNQKVTRATERAMTLRARRRRAHREDEHRPEDQMDEQSSCSLSRKIADDDLVAVDEKLERLDDHVTDEKRPERFARGVPRHPVDHAETDERRPDVTREDLRRGRCREAETREHRLRRHEQRETEHHGGHAAEHESEARTHGAETTRTSLGRYRPISPGTIRAGRDRRPHTAS